MPQFDLRGIKCAKYVNTGGAISYNTTPKAGGGLLVAPTHLLEPEVPWENIEALIQAVKDFGTLA